MPLEKYLDRISPADGKYRHVIEPVTIVIVQSEKYPPFHQFIAESLEAAFRKRDDTVVYASDDPKEQLPDNADGMIQLHDLRSLEEIDPTKTLGRFPRKSEYKKRADRKVVIAGSVDEIPVKDDLTKYARTQMGHKAGHFTLIMEGKEQQTALNDGAKALVASMEGNTAVLIHDKSNPLGIFVNAVLRLAFLNKAEMVSTREGKKNVIITFGDWISNLDVRRMQDASHILSKAKPRPLIWDLDLRELGMSRKQQLAAMKALGTAGLGEGMQWTVIEEDQYGEPILAVTETGVTKTDADPKKGNVVAVYGATEFGSEHYILFGLPKGHLVNLFKHPSKQQMKDTVNELLSSFLRKKYDAIKDMVKLQPIWIDHPGSIETHESVLFAMISSLLESGKISSFKEAMEYITNGFNESRVLPVIPKGIKAGAKSGIHSHNMASREQKNKKVKVINADMEGFGYPHSPPCGSREATLILLSALCDSYKQDGPLQDDEIRIINLPGHGSFVYSKKNIDAVARDMSTIVQWEDHVHRY